MLIGVSLLSFWSTILIISIFPPYKAQEKVDLLISKWFNNKYSSYILNGILLCGRLSLLILVTIDWSLSTSSERNALVRGSIGSPSSLIWLYNSILSGKNEFI